MTIPVGAWPLNRYTERALVDAGWRTGSTLENYVAFTLHRFGFDHRDVEQQFRIGRYRVDFAWLKQRIVLEADGWHHRSPEGAAKDAERDSWLRSQGWLVLRVDDRHGEVSLADQMLRVAHVVRSLPEWRERP